MPGSGKSTLGVQLAKLIDRPFIDLDKCIEESEGQRIPNIFSNKGEDYFRKIENDLLRSLTRREPSFVMSTGGGTPCFYDAIDYMLGHGKVIFINVSTNQLAKRLEIQYQSRPKFSNDKKIEEQLIELAEERLPIYNRAHEILSEDNLSAQRLLEAIKK